MDALETRTLQLGRELLRLVRQAEQFSGPQNRLMGRLLRGENLKTSLFRLVDVLPALKTAADVNRHIKQYLAGPARWLPENGPLTSAVAGTARFATHRLARSFIAAADPAGAVDAALALRRHSMDFTIDLLGEAVVSEPEAETYARRYRELIEHLADRLPAGSVNVSVKLSSLFSQFDPLDADGTIAAVGRRLRPILQTARRRGAFVCFDMEQFAFKDLTLRIFKEILLESEFRDWPNVGIAIQAYLPASLADLDDLTAWAQSRQTPVGVRLVKGAYWDFECVVAGQNNWPLPVYDQKPLTDANFERLTSFLIDQRHVLRPAIASHNIRDIAHAMALAEQAKLSPGTLEFQMLFGMADSAKTVLVDLGQRVRVYAPVGDILPGMAYLVRRLLENTSNQSFLRAALRQDTPDEELLMNPLTIAPAKRPAKNSDEFRNESVTDFSRAASRDAMRQALAAIKPLAFPLVINGRKIATPQRLAAINPSHKNQIVGHSARATAEHAALAIAAAQEAFASWRNRPASDRADLLVRVAEQLRARRFELAALEVAECGKPWREADADVAEAIDFCLYYARQAVRLGQSRRHDVPGETNQSFYEPRGVTAVIAPWNFPLAILCGMTSAAVAAGNSAVVKPAEQSSLVAARMVEAFEIAGVPPGVVNYLPGIGEEVGPALVASPDVAMIAFTGSRQVGLAIQEAAAKCPPGQTHIKRVIAEMGGKNAILIDADADLDDAIHGVTASAFAYAGQKCSACSRLIVLNEIYDAFLARLVEAAVSLRIAPAEDPGCFVGPVIDATAHARILQTIERAKGQAKTALAADVGALADEGFFIAPHIFTDVDPASALAQEEIFGPVLACMRARTLDHALELANGTAYALTGGLYSRSPANIERARREFRVGNLYINRKITGALVSRQPFGGFKLSGAGCQAGGPDYLPQYMVQRVVTENTLRHGFAPGE